ncbi:hypothetical protein GOODEAATRI_034461 [Goodea atripinnis]|uniref:Uncharacterized protein n=1 Tax=Goodea atripinnis TaxID=208336 RepID=A0ABV0N6L2_9TELE
MTQFKEKIQAIQDDEKESLLEEYSEDGRLEQKPEYRADSDIPTYDLTVHTKSDEEGNKSQQEQDQREDESSQGPIVTGRGKTRNKSTRGRFESFTDPGRVESKLSNDVKLVEIEKELKKI